MRTALLCLVVMAGCAGPRVQTTEDDAPAPTTVPEVIQRGAAPLVQNTPKAPGLVVGVWRAGDTTWETFGPQAAEVRPDSSFRVASMTKPLVGLLLATYVVDGTLKYEDPIGVGTCDEKKVSSFCFRGAATTYQHLLQHTAGLPTEPDNLTPTYAPGDLQDFLARYELSIQPGARFRYSTVGYAALGMTLERVTRTPFPDALQQRVLTPLGLESTTFMPDPGELVPGYENGELVADPARPPVLWPSGGQASTPADMLHLAVANLQPDNYPDLAEAIRITHRVTSDISAFDTSNPALGWFYFEALDAFWHAGSAPGYTTFVTFSPRTQTAIVLLANTSVPNDGRFAKAAFQMLGQLAALP